MTQGKHKENSLLPKSDQTPAEPAQWSRSPPLGMLRPRQAGSWEPSPDQELHHTAPIQPQLSLGLDLAHAWHLQGQAEQPGSLPGHGHFIFPLHESKSYKNAPFFLWIVITRLICSKSLALFSKHVIFLSYKQFLSP